ncbi:unnamed protein product [Clonostachys rosea f. rosea IK726]|uniref:Uncharacterized protein n=1 Tax=Clonostachys rosea f. rosea IK726 TaxID=1349383 RepID=A0ACA9TZH4_BIOOC|nr:unnamed protein product [Clonostachys rosea f. rosea IK726]
MSTELVYLLSCNPPYLEAFPNTLPGRTDFTGVIHEKIDGYASVDRPDLPNASPCPGAVAISPTLSSATFHRTVAEIRICGPYLYNRRNQAFSN